MSTEETNSSLVPGFLVSTAMVTQSSIVLQPGNTSKSVPTKAGSLLLQGATRITHLVETHQLEDRAAFRDLTAPDVKVSAKGRRPKTMITESKAGIDLGMLADRPMCQCCGKYFMSRQQLNQHTLVHTDVRKYKCTYCERTFKQPSHLHQHHRIHTGEKPYKCPMPGCFRAFPQQSNLNHHLRNHDKPAPPPENTCSLCMRAYASETVLRSHISKIHMCDPDMLLGARKKILTKGISKTQACENISLTTASENQSHKRIKLSETNSSDSSFETNILVPQKEAVDVINVNAHSYMNVQENGALNWKVGNLVFVGETLTGENGNTKTVEPKNNVCTSKQTDSDLLQHFIETTSHISTSNNSNEIYMACLNKSGGKTDASEVGMISGLSLSVSSSSVNDKLHSDLTMFNDTRPSNFGRSRKRKAFQPQRIVQKVHVKDQEDIDYTDDYLPMG